MKLKFLGLAALTVALTSPAFAASNIVAQVVALKGEVKVENAQGKRVNATPNMQLTDGSTLIVLKGNVTVKYKSSDCVQTSPANTLMPINAGTQCKTLSQQIAVGQFGPQDQGGIPRWVPPAITMLGIAAIASNKPGSR